MYTKSPDANVSIDKESRDEDAEGDYCHLPPRQLLAGAEILLRNNARIDRSDEPCATSRTDNRFQEQNPHGTPKLATKTKTNFPNPDFSNYEFLLLESTEYAASKNSPVPKMPLQELKCAIAILVFSGFNENPGKRYYWDSQPVMENPLAIN
ncbi:hypothetical protein JTB14_006643 [Gonioctena quinquepunctata]|nr:hypothetical protein JTB14_006643 [Gonioctena quinquepunctata]